MRSVRLTPISINFMVVAVTLELDDFAVVVVWRERGALPDNDVLFIGRNDAVTMPSVTKKAVAA